MTTILIISNVVFIFLAFYFARKSYRKSVLLKANGVWSESFGTGEFDHKNNPGKHHSLREAARIQKLTNDWSNAVVPQPKALKYTPESWKEE